MKECDIESTPFSDHSELLSEINSFSKKSLFILDSELKNNVKGIEIGKKLKNRGFKNLTPKIKAINLIREDAISDPSSSYYKLIH